MPSRRDHHCSCGSMSSIVLGVFNIRHLSDARQQVRVPNLLPSTTMHTTEHEGTSQASGAMAPQTMDSSPTIGQARENLFFPSGDIGSKAAGLGAGHTPPGSASHRMGGFFPSGHGILVLGKCGLLTGGLGATFLERCTSSCMTLAWCCRCGCACYWAALSTFGPSVRKAGDRRLAEGDKRAGCRCRWAFLPSGTVHSTCRKAGRSLLPTRSPISPVTAQIQELHSHPPLLF